MKTQEVKSEEVIIRNEARKKRTNKEQLALLDKRLGTNIGAKKERKRLIKKG